MAGVAAAAGPAAAGDAVPFTWTGVYIGAHTGGAIDYSKFSNPYGPTLFGDEVRSPGPIGASNSEATIKWGRSFSDFRLT
jgi:hypothetical protein